MLGMFCNVSNTIKCEVVKQKETIIICCMSMLIVECSIPFPLQVTELQPVVFSACIVRRHSADLPC